MIEAEAGVAPHAAPGSAPARDGQRGSLFENPFLRPVPRPELALIPFLAAILGLWIATHPYYGIIHDARLYAVQALNDLSPGRFSSDLYLKYGSQDSFTLFSWVYKPFIAVAGLGVAHLIGVVLGQALWLAAAAYLLRGLFGAGRPFLFAMLAVIGCDAHYGSAFVFQYAETFLAPRLWAEAAVLAALGLAARGRYAWAGACLLGAAAIHPLMALAGIAVLAMLAALHDRRMWLIIGVGLVVCLALAVSGLEPFSRALIRFDEAWFRIIYDRDDFVFLTRWTLEDFLRLASLAALLGSVGIRATLGQRRMLIAVTLASVAGLAVTLIAGDLGRILLAVDLQLWRTLWIATFVANACIGVLLTMTPRGYISSELLLFGAISGVFSHLLVVPSSITSELLLGGCLALEWERRCGSTLPLPSSLAAWVAASILFVWIGRTLYHLAGDPNFPPIFLPLLFRTATAAGAIGLLYLSGRSAAPVVTLAAAAVLVVCAAGVFDQRSAWERYIERPTVSSDLRAFVGASPNVYWENGLELMWFKLRMPTYYSCHQGPGVLFYRGTAIEFAKRRAALQGLDISQLTGNCAQKSNAGAESPLSLEKLEQACRSLPDLDALVLMRQVPGAVARTWKAPVAQVSITSSGKLQVVDRYYRYDCANFR